MCVHVWAGLHGYTTVQKGAKSLEVAVNLFCWRLIALIALALQSGSSRKGTCVTSWIIHLHSSSLVFLFFLVGHRQKEGMSYLPQTTLQGRGLDDISWNKAAERAEQSRSCWSGWERALPATHTSLQQHLNMSLLRRNGVCQVARGRRVQSAVVSQAAALSLHCCLSH